MRKIRFRGRTEHGTWKFGDLIQYETGEMAILNKFSQFGYEATEITNRYKVIPKTVGQYTGLKDKNDVEIYEGDIVKVMNATLAAVNYSDDRGAYYLDCGTDIGDVGLLCQYETLKVLGNQFENPELLEGGN